MVRGLRTEIVVGEPDARLERLDESVDETNRPRLPARGGREARRVAAREHQRADVGELESVSVVILEQPGRRVGAEPLEEPTFVQPRALGELGGGDRPGAVEMRVDAEPVAEMDHQ